MKISNRSNVHFRTINLWFAFVVGLIVMSNIQHQSMPVMSWLNCSLFFLIFLQCVIIVRKENKNRGIFFNIAALSLLASLSFVNSFIGTGHLLGNDFDAYYVFQYRKMIVTFLLGLAVTYILVRYVFISLNTLKSYLVTLAILLPVFLLNFWPFLADKNYLVNLPDNGPFYKAILYFTSFSFLVVWLYGVFLYKNERSLGEHVNVLMVCFFFMTLFDIIDSFGLIYRIKLFSLSQYLLLIIHSFFIVTLIRRLNFVYSDFGRFYDSLVMTGNNMGVPIRRKKSAYTTAFIKGIRAYFHYRKNLISLVTLCFLFGVNYFNVSLFLKINLAALWFGVIILFAYVSALYQKRLEAGNLLALRR